MVPAELFLYFVAIFVTILIYQHFKRSLDLPPGPWNLPIVGYLLWLNPKQPQLTLTNLARKYGPIFAINMGSVYTVVVSDFKLMKNMFMKDELSGRPRLYLQRHLSNFQGLLLTQGELWKSQRKFSHNFLKNRGVSNTGANREKFEEDVNYQILDFLKCMEEKSKEGSLEAADILMHNVACLSSLMLLNFAFPRDDPTWNKMLDGLRDIPTLVSLGGPLNFLPFFRFIPGFTKQEEELKIAVGRLHSTFKILIHTQNQSSEKTDSRSNLVEAFHEETLKRANSNQTEFFNKEQMAFLLNDFFMASVETIVTAVCWCLLYFAEHQDVQDKVREEIKEVLQGEHLSYQRLPELPYLDAFISEVARIRTVVPMAIPHTAMEDVQVEQYTLPKGTMILSLMWAVHMDPALWGDPENFRPERFISEEGKCVKPEYFIPFHVGKRICLGEDLAKRVVFLFVAHTVKHFKIESEGPVDLIGDCGFTVVPKPQKLIYTKL